MILGATAENIERAAAMLRAGEVVAFPTETVYGLGADATNARAVARIFAIKERPRFDPLIVHLDDAGQLSSVAAEIPEAAHRLAQRFWPGPLTLVFPRREVIPDIVTAGLESVAVRVPDHPVARKLLRAADVPVAAPSANPFGFVSPTCAAHVAEQLGERVSVILDGGPCRVGVESTILSMLEDPPVLLRPGGLSVESIEAEVGTVRIGAARDPRLSPGGLPRHYAPETPVLLVTDAGEVPAEARQRAALLVALGTATAVTGFARVVELAPDGDPDTAAARLFATLRELDRSGFERIYAVAIPETGLGRAIMDRLRRAGESDG